MKNKKKKKEIPKSVIRRKTITIFLIRKFVEIVIFFAIISSPYITGYYILGKENKWCNAELFSYGDAAIISCDGHYMIRWFIGFLWLFIAAGVIALIIAWIKWNWDEAEFKAKDKLGYYD